MGDDGEIVAVEKVIGGLENRARRYIPESIIPVIFIDVLNRGGTDVPVGVVDVRGSNVAALENARPLAFV